MELNASAPAHVVIGEQSLLIQCCELMLARGHRIVAVVSNNTRISAWCSQRSVRCLSDIAPLRDMSFDYLHSITNLRMLPRWLIERPARMSVNFHDGPLPRYAGLNAPVWALINNEKEHGITWHRMEVNADVGDVLVQRFFEIQQDDTVFSLNARCYEAGLDAFAELLDQIESDQLQPQKQDLDQRTYFSLAQRPPGLGLINFQHSAVDIHRFQRALDFGPYANPLCTPKILLASSIVLAPSSTIVPNPNNTAAGTVLAIDELGITIACATDALRFARLTDHFGREINIADACEQAGLSVGASIPRLDVEQLATLARWSDENAKHENRWRAELRAIDLVEPPFARKSSRAPSLRWMQLEFSAGANNLAIIVTLLSRLSSKPQLSLGYISESAAASARWQGQFIKSIVPFNLRLDYTRPSRAEIDRISEIAASPFLQGGFVTDLPARDPDLRNSLDPSTLPIRIIQQAAIDSTTALELSRNATLSFVIPRQGESLGIVFDEHQLNRSDLARIASILHAIREDIEKNPQKTLGTVNLLDVPALAQLQSFNQNLGDGDPNGIGDRCVHQLFEHQVTLSPERIACIFEGEQCSYSNLNGRANRLARHLQALGTRPGDLVGVMVERSIDMLVALYAVHKVGAAYVPLDPVYPSERLAYMIEDSQAKVVITQRNLAARVSQSTHALVLEDIDSSLARLSSENLNLDLQNTELAYVIYTSGSTGKPKGVMVEHRHVVNFFIGMDHRLEPGPGIWLAVTSISFDISVLELFWTLSRGLTILLYADSVRQKSQVTTLPRRAEFGLFYWNVADEDEIHQQDKYRLLMEGATFADRHGFNAVWNPERHFESFGGLFPNPAVTGAAIAAITKNISIRAGSCVVPLHSPIRIAEEWSVVDNLSNGRAGVSIAAGWAPPDFAIKPENFANAKQIMFENAATVRRLWRGERVAFPGPNGDVMVRTLPRPIQKELPIWVTTAGNIDTFVQAGKIGANLLTHLLGQSIEELVDKIEAYREAYREAGHPGRGVVTLMLHTFVGADAHSVEAIVRGPLKAYLRSAMNLVKAAAWQFPTFKRMSEEQGRTLDEIFANIDAADLDDLLEFAFQRYFRDSGLFGTPAHCLEMVERTLAADVDEIACLIDFGIDTDIVLEHLRHLNELKELAHARAPHTTYDNLETRPAHADHSIPALFARHEVTHFQCTPSMATMLVGDEAARPGLAKLKQMMVGGEAFPPELAQRLRQIVGGRVTNMYGPTETTIWSAIGDLADPLSHNVSIGRPLPNQHIYVLDAQQQRLPQGMAGELVIGGASVVRGYWQRPELTAERFLPDPFGSNPNGRMYRTGDLARYRDNGDIECLGRLDYQVKIRGYRVELGEIEALLRMHTSVLEAAVVLREDQPGDQRLIGYVRSNDGSSIQAVELKQWLRQQLPEFMVPSAFVQLAALPLTPNGKVDRKALPAPVAAKIVSNDLTPPQNSAEHMISEIWKRALGIPQVGTRDNFFDIGGHSLLVVQVLKELRERVQKPIQMTDLFKHTTIEALARFIATDDSDRPEAANRGKSRAEARRAAINRRRG